MAERAARLLEDPQRDLDAIAEELAADHGERAWSVLWQLLVDRDVSMPEARDDWLEARALRDRLERESGEETPLLATLYLVARRRGEAPDAPRIVSGQHWSRLLESSITDALTGLYNYRYFQEAFYRELKRSKRYRHTLSLLILDLDDFKSYNDAYGHPAGDRALRETARLLVENTRDIDIVCRYGGEEFTIVLPATDKKGARILGEKLRRRIEEHAFPHAGITVSGGISSFPEDGLTTEQLLANADDALYQAKNFIKNAVCYYFRQEKRAWPRIEKEYRLRYRLGGEEVWEESFTRDISRGGLSLHRDGPPPGLGEGIEIEILSGGAAVRLEGRIVRVERFEPEGDVTLGIAFEEELEETEEAVRRLQEA